MELRMLKMLYELFHPKWLRFVLFHKQLVNAEQNSGVYSSNNNETFMNCICDCNSSDLEKFAPLFVQRLSIQLIPLLELAPCVSA